jgi:phosphatidylglycerol---prolipoprotein diacylglyceryl transferase
MKPALWQLRLGELTVALPSYGTAVMLGFLLATWVAVRQADRTGPAVLPGFARSDLVDLAFYVLLAGVAGSRVLFVLLEAGHFARLCVDRGDCLAPLRIWDGGLVFYGGVLAAALVTARFVRRRRWSFAVMGDILAPALALGHAVGRLGCLMAGCCFGKVCAAAGPPCLAFPPGSIAHSHLGAAGQLAAGATATPPLHPTQLYESAALIALFFLLVLWRRRQRFFGQLFAIYLLAYGLLRFVLEVFRGDVTRRFVFTLHGRGLASALGLPPGDPIALSTSQALGLALALFAGIFLIRKTRAAIHR